MAAVHSDDWVAITKWKLTVAALDAVGELRSALCRANLAPLEQALAARRDSTSAKLARRARELRTAGGLAKSETFGSVSGRVELESAGKATV